MVNDIGRKNLQTNYYTFYMIITCFLIILSITACATSIYLIVENYKDAPDTDIQKALSYFSAITLGLIAFVLGLYYIFYISNSIWHSDVVATDLTRISSEPIDEYSFKNNLSNFVADKTGQNKNDVFNNLNNNMSFISDRFNKNINRETTGQPQYQTRTSYNNPAFSYN
jgi:hypothetical protein